MSDSYSFGQEAEQKAVEYLGQNGFEVLERNFHYRKAEIDIIAKKNNLLVIVEVKARSSDYFGVPESFVSKKKIQLLVMAVDAYLQKKDWDLEVRFDIITYLVKNGSWKQEHIEDAFYPF